MKSLETTEKEFRVINEINRDLNITQREISQKSGMSLGMTNIILKRLINKGYIKVKQLNKKKAQYLLTSKGFTEKAKKSYNYTLKTINALKTMKIKIQDFIFNEYQNGQRKFVIYGNTELTDLVEISIHALGKEDIVYRRINGNDIGLQDTLKNATVLLTEPYKSNNVKGVDIISILSS